MQKESYDIIFPFHYLALNTLPVRHYSLLEHRYNDFLREYVWQFIDAYNYQFANSKHIRFCLGAIENCIFEGELFDEKGAFFHTFKINTLFLRGTTDFVDWKCLAKLQSLSNLEQLGFDFYDKWLSAPDEAFFAHFQQLKEVNIKCHCTGGFDNFINANEIEETLRKGLPYAKIVIDITADFYY